MSRSPRPTRDPEGDETPGRARVWRFEIGPRRARRRSNVRLPARQSTLPRPATSGAPAIRPRPVTTPRLPQAAPPSTRLGAASCRAARPCRRPAARDAWRRHRDGRTRIHIAASNSRRALRASDACCARRDKRPGDSPRAAGDSSCRCRSRIRALRRTTRRSAARRRDRRSCRCRRGSCARRASAS